jgi:D-serine deaminase-like pyridoxal phosphate-dependent protein
VNRRVVAAAAASSSELEEQMGSKNQRASRRGFLSAAATASVFFWIPKPVKGYTGRAMRAIASGGRVEVGVSKWDLDTPALCLDLDRFERNIASMQAAMKKFGIASRPHAKTHKCAAIAKYQLATGSIGICCAKISEAEALAAEGVDGLLMTTANPAKSKVRRAMALRKAHPDFIQAVDHADNARDLSAAAAEAGVVADVVIDVAVGSRTGIPPGESVLELGQLIDSLPHLRLRGMLSYDGGAQHVKGFEYRRTRALGAIEANTASFEMMRKAGLNTEIYSGGGTGTYNIYHVVPGFTDVQVGSYVFMDMQYMAIGSESGDDVYSDFAPSLTVTTTVMNDRFPERLTTDAGTKALTLNTPPPGVIGEPGMTYNAGSDEFGSIRFTSPPSKDYRIGDKLELIVPHCDPVVNLYDQIYGIRGDRVEVVWPITARGKSQ